MLELKVKHKKKIPNIKFCLVYLEAHFLTIIDMDELGGSWQPKVIVYMYWYDERLEYQNLKEDDNLNILTEEERDAIWLPTGFFFENISLK